jgi:hypothetical protein
VCMSEVSIDDEEIATAYLMKITSFGRSFSASNRFGLFGGALRIGPFRNA